MNPLIENKSSAVRFLEDYERLQNEHATALKKIAELEAQCAELYQRTTIQDEVISTANAKADKWLRYAATLSSQLQFMVAGAARALAVAGEVQRESDERELAAKTQTNVEELEAMLRRRPATPWDDGSQDRIAVQNINEKEPHHVVRPGHVMRPAMPEPQARYEDHPEDENTTNATRKLRDMANDYGQGFNPKT